MNFVYKYHDWYKKKINILKFLQSRLILLLPKYCKGALIRFLTNQPLFWLLETWAASLFFLVTVKHWFLFYSLASHDGYHYEVDVSSTVDIKLGIYTSLFSVECDRQNLNVELAIFQQCEYVIADCFVIVTSFFSS